MVTVSSVGHRIRPRSTSTTCSGSAATTGVAAYGQSKLANLLFTYELQRRLAAKGEPTIAVAAHPGCANTELMRHMPGPIHRPAARLARWSPKAPTMGALPTLRAATDPACRAASTTARTASANSAATRNVVKSSAQSHDEDLQRRLWTVSEELTGVTLPGLMRDRRGTPARRRRPDHRAGRRSRCRSASTRPGAGRRCRGAAVAARVRQLGDGRVRRASPTTSPPRRPSNPCCCPSPRTSRPAAPTRSL